FRPNGLKRALDPAVAVLEFFARPAGTGRVARRFRPRRRLVLRRQWRDRDGRIAILYRAAAGPGRILARLDHARPRWRRHRLARRGLALIVRALHAQLDMTENAG